jgi:ubiquinol-cytochrome c reductase iron-sulfur subunit
VSEEHRTPVTLSSASFDDAHMQPAAQHPESVERRIAVLLFLGFACVAGFGAAYWQNWANWALGTTLGMGMLFIGLGLAAWGKYLMPKGPFVEERHALRSSDAEREGMAATIVERGGSVMRRRKVLGGLLGAGLGTFGIVAAFPLLRSLGPLPKNTLDRTNWKKNSYVVYLDGTRVHVDDFSVGTAETVFPEGFENNPQTQSQDQTMLIRVSDRPFTTKPGREGWTPAGYVAYSKLCTHLGCPVGLYEKKLELLVCPCHQSMFNVMNGAVPQFGPAPRPLPQLPLTVDKKGYLMSSSGYHEAVGPGFWERS